MKWWAALVVLMPSGTAAQWLAITPIGGIYIPFREVAQAGPDVICDHGPCGYPDVHRRVRAAPAAGLKLALHGNARSSFELSVLRVASDVVAFIETASGDSAVPTAQGAVVRNTFVALRYTFAQPLSATTSLSVGLGPALNSLRGSAYDQWVRNALGASFAAALQTQVSPTMRLEVGVTHTLYSLKRTGESRESLRQQDLVASAGLAMRLPL
jgi:hypothetical protein